MSVIPFKRPAGDRIDTAPLVRILETDSESAPRRLAAAIRSARSRAAQAAKVLAPNDHNAPLERIEVAARALLKAIDALRDPQYIHAWDDFWLAEVFGPEEEGGGERSDIVLPLKAIAEAAAAARHAQTGRPKNMVKLVVVKVALKAYSQYSDKPASSTATGRFADFARAFYESALGRSAEDDGGLDRQIKDAVLGRKPPS